MSSRRDHMHTAFAVVASALLHAGAIGVAGYTSSAILAPDSPDIAALPASLPLPPIILPPPPPQSDAVAVGNPDSTITAETWLGYNEFKEHVATTRGPIDQPALTFDPPSSQPEAPPAPIASPPVPAPAEAQPALASDPSPAPLEAPPPEPQPAAPRTPEPPEPAAPQTSPPADPLTMDPPQEPQPAPLEETEPSTNPPPGEEPAPPIDTTPLSPSEPAELEGPPAEPIALPEPPPETPPEQLEPRPPSTPPSVAAVTVAPARPAPPPSPSATDDARGEQSDRESDAAAIKTAARAHLGKPLATKGLRIRTVRPRTSHYNAILARYIDPVVRVHFDRRGVVSKVEFIRRSENRDVDLYVLNAVYQWTAEGPQLDELPVSDPPATIAVEFIIVRPLSG